MKKILFILLGLIALFGFTACDDEYVPEGRISVILPSGTPQLVLGPLMASENDIEAVTNTDLLRTALMQNTHDIIIAPLTMGATLYKGEKTTYRAEAIITINNCYLVAKEGKQLNSLSDVAGADIIAYQETNTPGIILKMAMENANVSANVQYEANVNAAKNLFVSGDFDYCLIAEPQLSQLELAIPNLKVLNLGNLFTSEIDFMPQAVIYVRDESRENKDVQYFLNQIANNIKSIEEDPEQYANSLIASNVQYFNVLTLEVLKLSIPRANLQYYKASSYKTVINKYFELMNNYANGQFGDWTPNENFYN